VSAALLFALTACGGSDDPAARTEVPGTSAGADVSAVQEEFDVPEDCREPFPGQLAPADLVDISIWPENFPEPPVAATLCQAEESEDGTTGTVGYATDVPSAQVLDTYRAALAPYELDNGGGADQITGSADDDTLFSITAPDGTIRLTFAKQ